MNREPKEPRFDRKNNLLTIATKVMKGSKETNNVVTYQIENLHPDERVANPAFALFKLKATDDGPVRTGEVWHIAVETYGPTCSCPHATFRGANSQVVCKHIKAARAVGLIPKGK